MTSRRRPPAGAPAPAPRHPRAPRRAAPSSAGIAALDHIRRLERGLRLVAREVEASTGISAAQLFVLGIVARRPAASLGELAAETLTDRSSVSVVIERLAARGLVRRKTSPTDARRIEAHITPAGRRLLARAPTPPTVRLLAAVASLSLPARRRLAAGLGQLNAALGFAGDAPRLLFEEPGSKS